MTREIDLKYIILHVNVAGEERRGDEGSVTRGGGYLVDKTRQDKENNSSKSPSSVDSE